MRHLPLVILDVKPQKAMWVGPEPFRDGSLHGEPFPESNSAAPWCANIGTEIIRRPRVTRKIVTHRFRIAIASSVKCQISQMGLYPFSLPRRAPSGSENQFQSEPHLTRRPIKGAVCIGNPPLSSAN